jgi:hypothetical protein
LKRRKESGSGHGAIEEGEFQHSDVFTHAKTPIDKKSAKQFKKLQSAKSMAFEFGDDEKNDKKLKEMGNEYFYPAHEVSSI